VFTAFSGSHQDAIKKGMDQQDPSPGAAWAVPYLPLDPQDIGRTYEAIIRINSQSGKGGVAYILGTDWGFQLPKEMQRELGKIVNDLADERGIEIASEEVFQVFQNEYLDRTVPLDVSHFRVRDSGYENSGSSVECTATLSVDGAPIEISGGGNGPIAAFVDALNRIGIEFDVSSYAEHSLGGGAGARAVAYVELALPEDRVCFGAAVDTNIEQASISAVISGLNRAAEHGHVAVPRDAAMSSAEHMVGS
jgi:2-isopropylmalate synthase